MTNRPWHLWVIPLFAILWNSLGVFDFFMTVSKNEAYLSQFSQQQLAFFYGFPLWVYFAWAAAIFGGFVGSFLLVFRKRTAIPCFLVSFIAILLVGFQNYVLDKGMAVMGDTFSLVFEVLIIFMGLGLYLYARAMLKQNRLQ